MAASTARSRSWRPCTSEQTPILTRASFSFHLKVGLFRLEAVGHPLRPCVLTHRAERPRVAVGTPIRGPFRLKEERPRFSPEKRPSASTVPMLMGYGAAVKKQFVRRRRIGRITVDTYCMQHEEH